MILNIKNRVTSTFIDQNYFLFLEAARDLQLVQVQNSEGSTTSSLRSRRRQSPHPQERNHHHRRNTPQRQNVYDESSLQNSIYRKFEETETLLDQLRIQEGFGSGHRQVGELDTSPIQ